MRVFNYVILLAFLVFGGNILFAQTHVSVPLGHEVYYILDQAEARFLCSPLPAVKPYTRARIVEAINEILAAESGRSGGLSSYERQILENTRNEFTKGEKGLDLQSGVYRFDVRGKKGINFYGDMGIALESLNSVSYFMEKKEPHYGTDTWGTIFLRGNISDKFSFNVDFSVGMMKAYRDKLGEYDTYATELNDDPFGQFVNRRLDSYGLPLAFFPYTYHKGWDGTMVHPGPIKPDNMKTWPQELSIAARMMSEMAVSVFDDMLLLRFGRIQREWGAMSPGSSLVLNSAARPFTGIEANFNLIPWFAFSSITGVLEYDNFAGIGDPAMTFQNAFSLQQVELNYRNYFHIDFGSAAIWAKRFELGYLFPLLDNYFYQNFIGDYDNMAIHLNIKAQYPGLGKLWFSLFADEFDISSISKTAFELDRQMFAFQAGLQGIIPGLPFTSLTLSYTKVEPYNYTHMRNFVPWYNGREPMEYAYVNNGVSLGHYIPPNSDEIKLRFDTHPWIKTASHFQYQLIRHGADFGAHQVDGSSLVSELDPDGRNDKDSLRKNFLKDGAYQWTHITKIGAEHRLGSLPITVFGEAGIAYSFFTDISDAEYKKYIPTPEGGTPRPSAPGEYLTSTAFILALGFRIFM